MKESRYIVFKKPQDGSNNYYLLEHTEDIRKAIALHIKESVTDTLIVEVVDWTKRIQ